MRAKKGLGQPAHKLATLLSQNVTITGDNMTFEEVGKPRYTITESAEGITFRIPSRKNWFMILFLMVWLTGWAIGEVTVIGTLVGGIFNAFSGGAPDAASAGIAAFGGIFTLVWLCAWTAGGAFAIYAWLWQVKGAEEVSISYDSLVIEKRNPLWNRSKKYRLEEVTDLRVSTARPAITSISWGLEFWGLTGGQLAFDYGAKTVRFGIGLDEAEAKHILQEMHKLAPKSAALSSKIVT